jgi:hypothetical protein
MNMFCSDTSEGDVNMQELSNSEKAEIITEEDITSLATRKKTPRDILKTLFKTRVNMLYMHIKMNSSWGKLLVITIKEQQEVL